VIIKAVLLTGLGCAALWSMRSNSGTTGPALRRLAVCALVIAGCLSVVFPSGVTHLANVLGVGRGADLVLYTLAVASLFGWIGTHKRLRQIEDDIVTLARRIALDSATSPTNELERGPKDHGEVSPAAVAGWADEDLP
jgi:hypothetical protein